MLIVGLLGWWYTAGWKRMIHARLEGLSLTADYFSIGLLAKTLFAPFRQISAGGVRGPIGVQIRAFFDKLISRCIGAIVRTIMIVLGVLAIALQMLFSLVGIIMWAFIPLLPFIGAIVAFLGWIPRWM